MRILVAAQTNKGLRDIMWPNLEAILSGDYEIKWKSGTTRTPDVVSGDGFEFRFISFEQGREYFQGLLFDAVMTSEPVPEDLAPYIYRKRLLA